MSKWFCQDNDGIKMLAFAAGFAVAQNNADLAKRAVPVIGGIAKVLDGDNGALNALFTEAVNELLAQSNPIAVVAINAALTQVKFGTIKLDNDTIRMLVDGFSAGINAAVKV